MAQARLAVHGFHGPTCCATLPGGSRDAQQPRQPAAWPSARSGRAATHPRRSGSCPAGSPCPSSAAGSERHTETPSPPEGARGFLGGSRGPAGRGSLTCHLPPPQPDPQLAWEDTDNGPTRGCHVTGGGRRDNPKRQVAPGASAEPAGRLPSPPRPGRALEHAGRPRGPAGSWPRPGHQLRGPSPIPNSQGVHMPPCPPG